MIEEQAKQSNLFILVGLGLKFIGNYLFQNDAVAIGTLFFLVGFIAFIWGCCCFAKGKGYSYWLGLFACLAGDILFFCAVFFLYPIIKESVFAALLALLPLVGLIVLVILPDRKW
jgi:hypothetical protein